MGARPGCVQQGVGLTLSATSLTVPPLKGVLRPVLGTSAEHQQGEEAAWCSVRQHDADQEVTATKLQDICRHRLKPEPRAMSSSCHHIS
jgi:hypothetical protein